MAHLMKKKHQPAKQQLLDWLWTVEDDGFWRELKSRATGDGKNWKKFGACIRKRWLAEGGHEAACNSLSGSQHCMQIWREVEKGY
mmetsp:Transcript_86720/g.280223  ORF Transcript_86720/g.280223 Transcript_86720/m.280223 type:complete len:85 (+) Transcript_86720:121-375(+)|eukprot:CAMPEP_0203918004 /NCGR_PEP_ID=MMETSP0359-20131031/58571_1 /ASSEMBLY_ACC=CAM_ASM_000338 /TAXON_ID=268821 /ORGANISM="Scrippsiella Hangoei, Strain SHTV-5" /LENGTH=84 /DNA_ID=CAMNT_0050845017 /DNA_START=80 /DNA_END=334 /DNA_ORIENTATION=+